MSTDGSAHRRVLAEQRAHITRTVGSVLTAGRPVALVNFPNHRNAGDSAIWLGAEAVLAELGVPVAYRAAWNTCSVPALRRAVGDGPILLNGGGNFGDLYEGQQRQRERLLATCRSNPIVQLPQSIHFEDPGEADRVARLVDGHGAVTILCRERQSLERARALFDAPSTFCPDLALALGPLDPPAGPDVDILWLARRDRESIHPPPTDDPAGDPATVPGADVAVLDWLEPSADEAPWPTGARAAYRINGRLVARMARRDADARRWWRALAPTFDPLARAWVARGLRILARGHVVVTDRLHAHILALLAGIPSVVLDNSYGKVHAVVEASTAASPLTHTADDAASALALARSLVPPRRTASRPPPAGAGATPATDAPPRVGTAPAATAATARTAEPGPRVVMTLLVRDERDIVADMLDFHYARGVDFVVATDNLSVDGTTEILRGYEREGRLRLIEEGEDTFDQARWVTRMARLAAREHDADWVINADADEFWWPTGGDLRSTLAAVPADVDVVVAQRFNFVAVVDEDGPYHRRMRWRYRRSVNHEGVELPPKVCHRGHPEAAVAMGNHAVEHPTRGELDDGRIVVLHFPMRSYAQFAHKIVQGGEAVERNDDLDPGLAFMWRKLLVVHREGRFEQEWRQWAFSAAQIAEAVEAGEVVEDRRVSGALARLGR